MEASMRIVSVFAAICVSVSVGHAAEDHAFCAMYTEEQSMLDPCPDCRLTVSDGATAGTLSVTSSAGWQAELTEVAPDRTSGAGVGRWISGRPHPAVGNSFDFEMATDGADWLSLTVVPHEPDLRFTINLGYRCAD